MLYPLPPPPGFAFHVVEVMSSPRYHLKRESELTWRDLRSWERLTAGRAGIYGGTHGFLGRDRGGGVDCQRYQEGKAGCR
jgi:hypothetical protein